MGPAETPEAERRTTGQPWRWLVIGVAVFLAAVFAVSRVGAEHGNQSRFQFPDRLDGVRILSPDRAPEARAREIVARYDRRGDGVAGMVVAWFPATELEDIVDPGRLHGAEQVRCTQDAEVLCVFAKRDGWVRVTQNDATPAEVRAVADAFRVSVQTPESLG